MFDAARSAAVFAVVAAQHGVEVAVAPVVDALIVATAIAVDEAALVVAVAAHLES